MCSHLIIRIVDDNVHQEYALLPRSPDCLQHSRLALGKDPSAVTHYHQQLGINCVTSHILLFKHNCAEVEQLSDLCLSLLEAQLF